MEHLRKQLKDENDYLRREVTTLQGSSLIAGASKALHHALDHARQVAPTLATVLLLGETGTGKELFASHIHDLQPATEPSDGPRQLRGHPVRRSSRASCSAARRALTPGALSRQAGRFEVADKSTLFLDEIGDLPLEMQVKLLRVLQERQIERLGSYEAHQRGRSHRRRDKP